MSSSSHAESEHRSSLELAQFSGPSTRKNRWRKLSAFFRCSRALDSQKINRRSLVRLVEDKSLGQLEGWGGLDAVAKALKTDLQNGIPNLDAKDIAHRQSDFGSNTFKNRPPKSFFYFFRCELMKLKSVILLAIGAISLGLGIAVDGLENFWSDGFDLIAVLLSIAATAGVKYSLNRQVNKLYKVGSNVHINVVRKGQYEKISASELVVGDVVCLKTGDQVPADGLLIENGHSLLVEEASERGEGDRVEVNYQSRNPFLFSGSKVIEGFGRMLVASVGMNTKWGQIRSQISPYSSEKTPLEIRVQNQFSIIPNIIHTIGIISSAFFLVKYLFSPQFNKSLYQINMVSSVVMETIAIFVETSEIYLCPMLSIVHSMNRMMADEIALVRHRSACESMAMVTTICTHKANIFTTNRVTKFWLGKEYCVAERTFSSISPNIQALIQEGVALNTIQYQPVLGSDQFKMFGSPTEETVLSWVRELNMDMKTIGKSSVIFNLKNNNPEKKCSGVVVIRNEDNTFLHVHWKGAAELILGMCSSYYDASGVIKEMGCDQKIEFEKVIDGMATSKLMCIAFAHKKVPFSENLLMEEDLILLALVGVSNPCPQQVKKAVKDCQTAGVSIKMMTNDHIFTAEAIAREYGILRENMSGAVIEAEEFCNYSPAERMDKIDQICVMARASPSDKLLMVQCLKRKGHVVAATGDDISELLVLKEADIGLCMGIQGSEVAKQSSDIVILDDNFASVVSVLSWGRCIYSNTQKLLQFYLTKICLDVVYIYGAFLFKSPLLSVVQVLWLDLIAETLSIFVFGMGKPMKELMQKPQMKWSEPLITNIMLRNSVPQSLYQIVVLVILSIRDYNYIHQDNVGAANFGDVDAAYTAMDTMIFNSWVLFYVFNLFNSRTLEQKNVFEGVHKNKTFLEIVLFIIVLQVMMVEFLNEIANTKRLNLKQWAVLTGVSALLLLLGLIVRCIPVPEKPAFFKYLCVGELRRYLERLILKKKTSLLIWANPPLLLMKFNQPSGAQNRGVTSSLIEEAGDGSHVINVEDIN